MMTDLEQAIEFLKDCVNWCERPMLTGIAGKRGEEIRAFIKKIEAKEAVK